jgi:hypothetical protein
MAITSETYETRSDPEIFFTFLSKRRMSACVSGGREKGKPMLWG